MQQNWDIQFFKNVVEPLQNMDETDTPIIDKIHESTHDLITMGESVI